MIDSAPPSSLERAWRQQSVWSQVAGRLKRDVKRSRTIVLALTIIGAMLASLAVVAGLESPPGKAFAFAGAVTVALAGVIRPRTGQQRLRDWTRARSASEAIKSEVFLYLTGIGEYRGSRRHETFDHKVGAIERDVADLLPQAQGFELVATPGLQRVGRHVGAVDSDIAAMSGFAARSATVTASIQRVSMSPCSRSFRAKR